MALRYGKKEVAQVVAAIDAEHATVEDAAVACLKAMEGVWEQRCRFALVAQLRATSERSTVPPSDPEAIKLVLGLYSTEGDARSAGESLWSSPRSGDTFRWWIVPVMHQTAADWHADRKAQYVAMEAKQDEARRQRFQDNIAKFQQETQDRADGKGACECGHRPQSHLSDGNSRGKCVYAALRTMRALTNAETCECVKFSEAKWTRAEKAAA